MNKDKINVLIFRSWYKETSNAEKKEIVILLDKSQMMRNKMRIAIESIKDLVQSLGPQDKVISYSSYHLGYLFLMK